MTDDAPRPAMAASAPERKPLSPAAIDPSSIPAAPASAAPSAKPAPKELQGPEGPEPTRYGDWESKGIASDF